MVLNTDQICLASSEGDLAIRLFFHSIRQADVVLSCLSVLKEQAYMYPRIALRQPSIEI